jgi:hypothetical protein
MEAFRMWLAGKPLYKTGYPDEENTPLSTQIIHKAFHSHLPYRDVCVIDAVFI